MRSRNVRLAGALLAGALVAACGSDDDSTADSAASTEAPVTDASLASDASPSEPPATGSPGTEPAATDAEPAEPNTDLRIVSLSPTHTEMLFAIGAGGQVVAVDDQSNYPPEALELPNELSGFSPDVEAIASFEPDLVVIGGDFGGLGDQLAEIGIDSWDGPAPPTIEGIYEQIEQLGAVTGRAGEAAELVVQMETDLEALSASIASADEPFTFYHEIDNTLFTVDSTTFIGEVYTRLGLRNIADLLESDVGGYPQLNQEFLVSSDPQLIFLADTKCCGETAETVAARDGWAGISAVTNGQIYEMDDDLASRWGPRIVDYGRAVTAAVEQAAVPS
jgi:iron complex transport system substrate-binding protein